MCACVWFAVDRSNARNIYIYIKRWQLDKSRPAKCIPEQSIRKQHLRKHRGFPLQQLNCLEIIEMNSGQHIKHIAIKPLTCPLLLCGDLEKSNFIVYHEMFCWGCLEDIVEWMTANAPPPLEYTFHSPFTQSNSAKDNTYKPDQSLTQDNADHMDYVSNAWRPAVGLSEHTSLTRTLIECKQTGGLDFIGRLFVKCRLYLLRWFLTSWGTEWYEPHGWDWVTPFTNI